MIRKLGKLNEAVINSKSFGGIKVKAPCKKKIFEIYPGQAFIVVLDRSGGVIVYEKGHKNTFKNLREFVSLYGSEFFKSPMLGTEFGEELKNFFEAKTGVTIREIYRHKL